MNNAVTEIKSTLEGTNSRITEAEERISEVKELWKNEAERKKGKRIDMRTTSETSGTMLNAPAFKSQVSQKTKTKRKGMKKYFRR